MEYSPRLGIEASEIGIATGIIWNITKFNCLVIELDELISLERNKAVHRPYHRVARPHLAAIAENKHIASASLDARNHRQSTSAWTRSGTCHRDVAKLVADEGHRV